jgi:chromosome segregation ATPase
MDPILIFLCTATGAVVGTTAGVLLLHRKLRPPITETELVILKTRLEANDAALAEATADVTDLRKQIAVCERTLQQNREALKEKQQQLDLASAEVDRQTAQRLAAEQKGEELAAQVTEFVAERLKLAAALKEESRLLEEKKIQIVSLDSELESGKKQVHELTAQVGRLIAESVELKSSVEQESHRRVYLEAQVTADQARLKMLTGQLDDLQSEHRRMEVCLHEERQSVRKGMELLLMAQEKLSHLISPTSEDLQDGNGYDIVTTGGESSVEITHFGSAGLVEVWPEGELGDEKVSRAS